MVEQVRIGAYDPQSTQSPWLLELIAGMVEEGELPNEVAQRESQEEAGVQVEHLREVMSFGIAPAELWNVFICLLAKWIAAKHKAFTGLLMKTKTFAFTLSHAKLPMIGYAMAILIMA